MRAQILKRQDAVHSVVIDEEARQKATQISKDFMKRQLPSDPALRAKLTPSYPFGCKRVVLSDDFYPAFKRSNVALECRPIDCITENGLRTGDTEWPVDVLIFATGFLTQDPLKQIDVIGKHGARMDISWRQKPITYLGVNVEQLPNFAMLYGPNTNLSHISVLLMIEAQARYISMMVSAVHRALRKGYQLAITPKPQAVKRAYDRLQEKLRMTVFADPSCTSWYKNGDNVVTNSWPGTAAQYQEELSVIQWDDYEVIGCEDRIIVLRGTQGRGWCH